MTSEAFDPVMILDCLQTTRLDEYSGQLSTAPPLTSDPLQHLQTMVAFYLEVHEASELYAHCMVEGVSEYLDPTIHCLPAPTLSVNEHIRIISALWILQIVHQLRSGVFKPTAPYDMHFTDALVKNLPPWYIDLALSLERKMQIGLYPHNDTVEYADRTDPRAANRLVQTRYIVNLHMDFARLRRAHGLLSAARQQSGGFPPHASTYADMDADAGPSSLLRNHIWGSSQSAANPNSILLTTRYRALCLHLSLFFWDRARLDAWHIADPDDLIAASNDARTFSLSREEYRHDDTRLGRLQKRQIITARHKERQITEWTRSQTNLGLKDWLHQKTLAARVGNDEKPFPRRLIVPGLVCSMCELDGHSSLRCRPGSWQYTSWSEYVDSDSENVEDGESALFRYALL